MGFHFAYVCDFLQRLENNQNARLGVRTSAEIMREWFARHRPQILREDHDAAALLSTLLPEKRTDRVYLIREKRLQTVVGRALGLGRSRISQLGRWTCPTSGLTLAECVESVLKETPNPKLPAEMEVTVEEIDQLLHQIASMCRFSSPAVRGSASGSSLAERELSLGNLYKRLTPRDAKWLTRLILKNFEPVILDPQMVYRNYHPSLPSILKVQDDLAVAGRILARLRRDRTVVGRTDLVEYLKPALGVKVGRQPWYKGRSIKHCLDMGHGRMSCESKIDGEYCQIHIDLGKGRDCIQIFSKSGKDSTRNRVALHDPIRQSLQLGQPSSPLKKGCILEGELVVWSDKEGKILDFHKIRKHVSRSGTFIGTGQDSQPHPWEHLMIVYYDVLMIDHESLLAVKQSERMKRLKQLVTEIPGQSALVRRQIIDCDRPSATSDLRRAFAKCIVAHEEGLVLKADDSYFDFNTSRRPYSSCAIKLKKEYVGNFGDIGDFAVVGARLDATKAKSYGMPNIKWTHFYVGCLENKEEIQRFKRKPSFVVTNVVELNATQMEMFITSVNPVYVPERENVAISLRIEPGIDEGKRPSVIFPEPPVFDVRCFSFDKAGNTGFWSPRFPMVNKIHCDRNYCDTLSFSELQDMAAKEKELPPPDDSQELLGWIAALENADPRRMIVDTSSQATTVSRTSTVQTPTSPSSQSQPVLSTWIPRTLNGRPGISESTSGIPVAAFAVDKTPVHDSLAPTTCSEVTPQNKLDNTSEDIRKHRKRASESCHTYPDMQPNRAKVRRRSAEQQEVTTIGPIVPSSRHTHSSNNSQREALTDVRTGSPRRNSIIRSTGAVPPRLVGVSSMYQSTMGETLNCPNKPPNTSSRALLQTASASFSLSSSRQSETQAAHVSMGTHSSGKDQELETNTCTWTCRDLKNGRNLKAYSFLLSPCIANFPWVTEDLLSCHGVRDFIRDPADWSSPDGGPSSTPPNKKKMAILVDKRRQEATRAFLKRVADSQLTRRNGERRWVDVYDWRVLEDLRVEEEKVGRRGDGGRGGGESSAVRAIWRRHWAGLA